tara:strand:+ start:1127 stop:1321 length:195 start_codon:yes stop_codon:yes gene_type:complete
MENKVIKIMKVMEGVCESAASDAMKFADGNNSAGTRVRKAMQNVKNLAQEIRVEVQNQKNSIAV